MHWKIRSRCLTFKYCLDIHPLSFKFLCLYHGQHLRPSLPKPFVTTEHRCESHSLRYRNEKWIRVSKKLKKILQKKLTGIVRNFYTIISLPTINVLKIKIANENNKKKTSLHTHKKTSSNGVCLRLCVILNVAKALKW